MDQALFMKELMQKVTIDWTIPDFENCLAPEECSSRELGSHISSHDVSAPKSALKWSIRIYPKGRSNPQFLDFSIICRGLTDEDEYFASSTGYFKSMSDVYPELHFKIPSDLTSRSATINESSRGWSTNKFLTIDDLRTKQILINRQLTVTCDIYFIPKSLPLTNPRNQFVGSINFDLFLAFLNFTDYNRNQGRISNIYPSLFNRFTDFKIISFDDENKIHKVIPCHKAILIESSTTFEAMLNHKSFVESATNTITIHDFAYDTIKAMIGFIYFGQIERNKEMEEIASLLLIADKYNIRWLKIEAAKILYHQHINQSNIIDCLSTSVLGNCEFLKATVCYLIRLNWGMIGSEASMERITKVCPSFQIDSLNVSNIALTSEKPSRCRRRIDSTGCQEEPCEQASTFRDD